MLKLCSQGGCSPLRRANLLSAIFQLGRNTECALKLTLGGRKEISRSNRFVEFPYTLTGLHTVISFGLCVSAVGLWVRRTWGLVISTIAVLSVLATYGYWYFMTFKYLSELRNNMLLYTRVQHEVGWFHGATRWDFVVLALAAILLLGHLGTLLKMTLERRGTSAGH